MATIDEKFSNAKLGFDPDELARRYTEEREKRVRPDAEAQFVQLSHDSPFSNKYLEEDPYSEKLERAPLKDERGRIIYNVTNPGAAPYKRPTPRLYLNSD